MKTLNEVITIMDGIDQTCTCCAYQHDCDETECVEKTALHYLKAYKRVQNKMEKIALGNIEDTLDRIDNPALTWEELKQMFHKPVWIETTAKKGWNIIVSIDSADMQVIHTAHRGPKLSGFSKADLGKTWQAYRKERS